MPWKAVKIELQDGTNFVHVIPNDDDRHPHYLDDYCLCSPRVEKLYEGNELLGLVWSHNSWDGREHLEKLNEQPML